MPPDENHDMERPESPESPERLPASEYWVGAGSGPAGGVEPVTDEPPDAEATPVTPGGTPVVRDMAAPGAAEVLEPPPEPPPDSDKLAVVEALLFVSPEPLSTGRISEITGIEQGAVREILNRLSDQYRERGGGLVVREVAGGFGFYASRTAAPFISRLISSQVNPRLTRAALETLAIVAYLQPVSRGVVAEIRGVQSEGVIKTLEDRGMVAAAGKGGPPGYPVLYGTTGRFLERFGLKAVGELPALEDFAPDEEMVERIKRSLSWEMLDEIDSERTGYRAGPGEGRVAGAGAGGADEESDVEGAGPGGAGEGAEDTGQRGGGFEEGGGGADIGRPGDQERTDGLPR